MDGYTLLKVMIRQLGHVIFISFNEKEIIIKEIRRSSSQINVGVIHINRTSFKIHIFLFPTEITTSLPDFHKGSIIWIVAVLIVDWGFLH